MKLDAKFDLDLKLEEAGERMRRAAAEALKDTVVEITRRAVEQSPRATGNNRRSIRFEVEVEELSGTVFSTSGYGGYLETGTCKMAARPYMKPALDAEFTAQKFTDRVKENL